MKGIPHRDTESQRTPFFYLPWFSLCLCVSVVNAIRLEAAC
jgi:hypothetical protein